MLEGPARQPASTDSRRRLRVLGGRSTPTDSAPAKDDTLRQRYTTSSIEGGDLVTSPRPRGSHYGRALLLSLLLGGLVAGGADVCRSDGLPRSALTVPAGAAGVAPLLPASPTPVVPTTQASAGTFGAPDSLSLTLAGAIEMALAGSPRVAAADWAVTAADESNQAAARERLPRLVGTGAYMRYQDPQRLAPALRPSQPATLSREILSGDLRLTLPLYTSGRLSNRIDATKRLRTSAEHRLARARQELAFEVTRTFVSILAQERGIESLRFATTVLEAHLRQVDDLIAAQKAARVDRLRTEVRLAETKDRLVREETGLAIQYQMFADLLGLERDGRSIALQGDLSIDGGEPTGNFGPSDDDLDSLLALAYASRDDLHAASSDIDATTRTADAIRAEGRPSLSLQAAYGSRYAAGHVTRTGDTDEIDDFGSVGIALDLPLFDGDRIGSRVDAERALAGAARERLRDLQLRIRLEVASALVEVRSARERLDMTAKSIEQAEEVLRIEQLKYELGQGTILDVLDAQAALLSSQTNHHRALADHRTSTAMLRLATGEGS